VSYLAINNLAIVERHNQQVAALPESLDATNELQHVNVKPLHRRKLSTISRSIILC